MKALLVNIDLMVRVLVPNNATNKQIIDAATAKAVDEVINDHNTISENVAGWEPDTSIPAGEGFHDPK